MGKEDEAGGVRGELGGEGAEIGVDSWGVGGGGGVDFLRLLVDFVDYGLGLGGAGGA